MDNYSIIIPTHNRHNLIKKNIEYFRCFQECQIYICDSSEEAYQGVFPDSISYLHMPKRNFVQKMYEVLSLIETECVAVCADDDYMIEETVLEIIEQLRCKDYVMGVGRYFKFNIPFEKFRPMYSELKFVGVDCPEPKQRVECYMSHYYMSLWAVYKKETIKKAYSILSKASFHNHNFIEFVIAITCSHMGKIYFSKNILGLREARNKYLKSWRHQHKNLLRYSIEDKKLFDEDCSNLSKYFDENIFSNALKVYLSSIRKSKFYKLQKFFFSTWYKIKYGSRFYQENIAELIKKSYVN